MQGPSLVGIRRLLIVNHGSIELQELLDGPELGDIRNLSTEQQGALMGAVEDASISGDSCRPRGRHHCAGVRLAEGRDRGAQPGINDGVCFRYEHRAQSDSSLLR